MRKRGVGIRAKVSVTLGGVLLIATLGFGVTYALIEHDMVLNLERGHLEHVARLASLRLQDVETPGELRAAIQEFGRTLSVARDAPHEIEVRDERGNVLAMSRPRPLIPRAEIEGTGMVPKALLVDVPLAIEGWKGGPGVGRPNRVVIYESLLGLDLLFRQSLLRHLLFAAGLLALVLLAAGLVIDRLVVGPIRELATLTDAIAQDGSWDPVAPSERRGDEIGLLGDRLAKMSRRLVDSVRAERYGSVNLVAARVRHELDEPLRRIAMHLAVLEDFVPAESDAARARDEIATEVRRVAELVRELAIAAPPRSPAG